jgi:hypothetical protein
VIEIANALEREGIPVYRIRTGERSDRQDMFNTVRATLPLDTLGFPAAGLRQLGRLEGYSADLLKNSNPSTAEMVVSNVPSGLR